MEKKQPSPAALAQAEALWRQLQPTLVEMIERCDPAVQGLTFNDIEGNAAAAGDLLAKLMMQEALERQPEVTKAEEQAARELALKRADSGGCQQASQLQMTHAGKRRRALKTARGEITFAREYLYFPELKTGIFPPGNAAGDTGRPAHTTGNQSTYGKGG